MCREESTYLDTGESLAPESFQLQLFVLGLELMLRVRLRELHAHARQALHVHMPTNQVYRQPVNE